LSELASAWHVGLDPGWKRDLGPASTNVTCGNKFELEVNVIPKSFRDAEAIRQICQV
jgi:hypothetical protein